MSDRPSRSRSTSTCPEGGALAGMAEDVREGLSCPFKELPPKYFYDERGSELFERITELPEYYPTRAERAILDARAGEIVAAAQPDDADRARLRRGGEDAAACSTRCATPARSRPTSPSTSPRRSPAGSPTSWSPSTTGLRVARGRLRLRDPPRARPRARRAPLIAFLGGTIGNFRPAPRRSFLARIATLMYPGDRFLLGTDLVKDRAVLEAAYNDSAGVTAEFNKNVLNVLNRELDADFDLDGFEHVAFFDAENEWIDIRLRSLAEQFIDLRDARHARPLRPQRGDADRDLDQVHPRAARGELRRRRARDDRAGGPTRTSLFALSLARRL